MFWRCGWPWLAASCWAVDGQGKGQLFEQVLGLAWSTRHEPPPSPHAPLPYPLPCHYLPLTLLLGEPVGLALVAPLPLAHCPLTGSWGGFSTCKLFFSPLRLRALSQIYTQTTSPLWPRPRNRGAKTHVFGPSLPPNRLSQLKRSVGGMPVATKAATGQRRPKTEPLTGA